MNAGFIEAFAQIIREKRVDKSTLVDTIKASLVSAAKRKLGPTSEVSVELDETKGMLEVLRVFKVVEEVTDAACEMPLEEAKEIDSKAKIGGEVSIPLPLEEFGRIAVQTAKQILMQRVREAERERIYEDYKDKVGTVVTGTVRQVDRGNILVNLGRAEAYLPVREQIRKEHYNQGDTIRACIIEVDKNAKGSQIIASRNSEHFLRKLFEQEVPEIFDGDVDIKSIAREPGGRSKIAVYSRNNKVDAVGSCVGMKGSRVQAVVNELHGEKIDIVNWSERSSEFVSRALAPAKVSSLRFNEGERIVLAVVDDGQLSLAIGREGQNVRLASKLTGWKINLIAVREMERRDKLEQKLQMDISEMYGVTPRLSQKLKSIGILTVQKLYKTPIEELLEINGIGAKTAEKLKGTAVETMEELNKALEELLAKELEESAEEKKALFDETVFGPEKEEGKKVQLTEAELFKDLEEKHEKEKVPEGSTAADVEETEEGTGGVDEGEAAAPETEGGSAPGEAGSGEEEEDRADADAEEEAEKAPDTGEEEKEEV